MQVLHVQSRALQRKGAARSSSAYRNPTTNLIRAGTQLNLSLQRSRSVFGACLAESYRHASSSCEGANVSRIEETQRRDDSSAAQGGIGSAAAASGIGAQVTPLDQDAAAAKRKKARDAIIQEIISRDKVVFELKRQHELSMLRVEQNQARVLKDQQDRGMYYEQNSNVHTFDTISVGLYSQRSTLYHTMSAERLRNLKIFLMVFTTFATCAYLYYRYIINPDWEYVERPIKMIGSRVQAIREQRWKLLSEEGRYDEMRKRDREFSPQRGH